MPYVLRNDEGRIIAVLSEHVEGAEMVSANDGQLTEFLQKDSPESRAQAELIESDLGIVRVLEDLIDILIERGHIMFTDFPEHAQKKLLTRRGFRKEFSYMDDLFNEDDSIDMPDPDSDGEGFL